MYSTATRNTTIISTATDVELFAQMAERGSEGDEACAEFHRRYAKDLHKLVCRLPGVPQASIEGLVQKTMIRAFLAARTFKVAPDVAKVRGYTLSWLCRIAHNIYVSELRQQRDLLVSNMPQRDGEDDSQLSTKGRRLALGELYSVTKDAEDLVLGNGNDHHISPLMKLVHEALDLLNDMERDILIATFDYYKYGQKQQRLPNKVVRDLCNTYKISPANLRQVRNRAFKKIKKYVDEHMSTEN